MKNRTIFSIALKCIGFAWRVNGRLLLILIALNVVQGAIVYLQFASFSTIVDEIGRLVEGASNRNKIATAVAWLGCSFLVPAILSSFITYLRTKFRQGLDLELDLYKIQKQGDLDVATIESAHYQNLLRSSQEWGTGSVLILQDFIFSSANHFSGIVTSLVILSTLSPWLGLFALAAAGPVYYFYKKYGMDVFRIRWFTLDDQRIILNRTSHFENRQKAIDVILLKLTDWLREQIKCRMKIYNQKILQAEWKKSIAHGLLSAWYLLFLFAAIGLMTREAMTGNIAVGTLLLAFTTYTRFYQTVNTYLESISVSEEAARYAGKWFDLLDLKPKVDSKNSPIRVTFDKPPLVEFKNVSFSYPSENGAKHQILKNISLAIRPGEKVALIGANGSGKTTLIKLLCRVYDPTDGNIEIDGVDLKDIHLDDWRSAIAVLFQDFPIYNLTIRESIGVGRITDPDYVCGEIKLRDAAELSGANEFINMFSNSYDQLIWKEFKDGTDLSRGQHQRLAIARMLYRNGVITILDEPTAAIDAVAEEKIFSTLEKNMNDKTVIIITHRFSTIQNVDRVLLLDDGKIIEQGTHLELVRLNQKYAELYTMQAKRYFSRSDIFSEGMRSGFKGSK